VKYFIDTAIPTLTRFVHCFNSTKKETTESGICAVFDIEKTDKTLTLRDSLNLKSEVTIDRTGGYLETILAMDSNNLGRVFSSTRLTPAMPDDDVLGIVYGIDGSVQVIGRNNTLEGDNPPTK
jgi:hypothetical protein